MADPAPARVATYPHDIPSLHQVNPGLPAQVLANLDVNRAVAENDPIDSADLANAKDVAKKLKATLKSAANPGVTADMVQSAELRLRAVEGAHAAAKYAPAGLMAGLAEVLERLDRIERNSQISIATTNNQRIIARNIRDNPRCEPLQKTVSGHGFALARAVTRVNERGTLVEPVEPAAIASVPPDFNASISNYTRQEIAELIIFYNEDFGIILGDDVSTRRDKLRSFLAQY